MRNVFNRRQRVKNWLMNHVGLYEDLIIKQEHERFIRRMWEMYCPEQSLSCIRKKINNLPSELANALVDAALMHYEKGLSLEETIEAIAEESGGKLNPVWIAEGITTGRGKYLYKAWFYRSRKLALVDQIKQWINDEATAALAREGSSRNSILNK
jgi:hypothetical protein